MSSLKTTKAMALIFGAMIATSAAAQEYPDMSGTWEGTYTAVSPTNAGGPGPRFRNAEWQIEISAQEDNVFWGQSKWRRSGSDSWTESEITRNLNALGSGAVGMIETSPDPTVGVNALINGQLDGDSLYIDFRGLRAGVTYSTVLHRSEALN